MCCSLAPAEFSETIIYASETVRDGKHVHVLGYQNTARHKNLAGDPIIRSLRVRLHGEAAVAAKPLALGNAMILPIPAVRGTLTSQNLVSTENCPYILKDMEIALRPRNTKRGVSDGLIGTLSFGARAVQIFEHDIYTVMLADDARDIPNALANVPDEKRPPLNPELFEAYAEWYPEWPVAVCCFSNEEAARANPLLWWYEPLNPSALFMPGLDSHFGGVPVRESYVMRDHVMAFSAIGIKNGTKVHYRSKSGAEVESLIASEVMGHRMRDPDVNGDWYVRVLDIQAGKNQLHLVSPPGLPPTTE